MSLHICTGTNRRFIARARQPGHRKCELVGRPRKTAHGAAISAVKRLYHPSGLYRYADVIMVADYYEPVIVFTAKRG